MAEGIRQGDQKLHSLTTQILQEEQNLVQGQELLFYWRLGFDKSQSLGQRNIWTYVEFEFPIYLISDYSVLQGYK